MYMGDSMRRLSQEEYEKRVAKVHGDNIKVLGEYVNRRTKILVQCVCGYEWETNPEPLTKGHGCPVCARNKRKTTEEFKREVYNLVGDEYEVLGKYINKDMPILIKHNLCNKRFKMAPNAFIQGQRCPHERYERAAQANTIPLKDAINQVKEISCGEYEIIGEYNGVTSKALIRHNKCGNIYRQEPTRIINENVGCPFCYMSKGENVIKDYLEENKYNFKEQVRIPDCKHIRPLPFDFGIYDDNENLLFLIEYDGIQHYYPKFGEKQFMDTKRNDKIKTDFCKRNNIPLIRIKYYRTENPMIFRNKITERLEKSLLDMTIPSQAYEETLGRCND